MATVKFDLDRARSDTPAVAELIHFNNAGAGLMPDCVVKALKDHIDLEARTGGYEAADQTIDLQSRTYDAAAALIHCSPDEIAVVENATVAWCAAFYGIAETFQPGDRIVTGMAEYSSNFISYLQIAKRKGIEVDVVPNDETGQLSLQALQDMINERTRLITISHVPTNGGLVNPAAGIGRVAKSAGIPYLLDACQSVGQLPVNVEEIGCDMLSATGRKYLRGPRGTGFLYVNQDMMSRFEPLVLDNHSADWMSRDHYEIHPDARRFENWENNIAGKIGLGVAIDYALQWGVENTYTRLSALAATLRAGLDSITGVEVRDIGAEQCGITTFTVDSHDAESIIRQLREKSVNTSLSTTYSTRLDMEDRKLDALIRASVHYYNSEDEIDTFLEFLEQLLR